jgi:autophagy-related protein 18
LLSVSFNQVCFRCCTFIVHLYTSLSLIAHQDSSCVAVGDEDGCRLYSAQPFGLCSVVQSAKGGETGSGVGLVEMLFSSSLLVLVGGGKQPMCSPRRLKLFDARRGRCLCQVDLDSAVLSVKLNRKRYVFFLLCLSLCFARKLCMHLSLTPSLSHTHTLSRSSIVVVMEHRTNLYDLDMHLLKAIETSPNPHAAVALSASDASHLALPSSEVGQGLFVDGLTLHILTETRMHKSTLAAMAFTSDATRLATASETGTIVRIWRCVCVPSRAGRWWSGCRW